MLESFQRNTTQEEFCRKFGISSSMVHGWRHAFQEQAATILLDQRDPKRKPRPRVCPGESPDELKKLIGDLSAQNEILKKPRGSWAGKTAQKVELAHQLCRPNGPHANSQVTRSLGLARGTLNLHSKQAIKDNQVAVAIEQWHDLGDTLGPRKLAVLLGMGKNRVKRVMYKYSLVARRKREKYVFRARRSSPRISCVAWRRKGPRKWSSPIFLAKCA